MLTTTSLRQEQQQRVLATVAANYIFGWLVVWLVGCCLSIRSEREQSSYGIDCILKPSFIWCHLVLQVVDSLSWVERETTLSPCLLCVSGPFLLLSVDNCTSLVEGDCFVNRARRSPPDFQSTEVERQVADSNVSAFLPSLG